jgi:hypothetical protein
LLAKFHEADVKYWLVVHCVCFNSTEADYAAKMRWDKFDPAAFTGSYGRYLMMKVSKVFPALATDYLKTAVG